MSAKKQGRKRPHPVDEQESEQDDFENLDLSDEEGGIRVDDIYIPPPPRAACSVQTTGPRLVITSIVNDFFKSYASQQKLGPFHKVTHSPLRCPLFDIHHCILVF